MEFDIPTLITILGSVVALLGGHRGVQALQDWRARAQVTQQPSPPSHWTETTGELRPVLSSECAARHAKLDTELQRGSTRFGELKDDIGQVREEMIGMRGEVKTGFASIPGQISSAAQAAINRHEDREHKD